MVSPRLSTDESSSCGLCGILFLRLPSLSDSVVGAASSHWSGSMLHASDSECEHGPFFVRCSGPTSTVTVLRLPTRLVICGVFSAWTAGRTVRVMGHNESRGCLFGAQITRARQKQQPHISSGVLDTAPG
ncbi:hypothetical protein DAEQUDRAFT_315165 [Daedalea quercina L-15889]|uniref:Uncharacterized protein n=1 Tax=Daedalea quercina L-15889 TaxID=1314783 RepID=A0A165PVQ2_9APHY|nr:hypothetical protein DAEQUDRAFT_315165 [Daedalea quercina L-15889]